VPILDLQQQMVELGRIRIGTKAPTKSGGSRPAKLDSFRFTSQDKAMVDAVAATYGGEALPWMNGGVQQFEVYTPAREVPILLPKKPVSQWYEMWSAGGCLRRCDGTTNVLTDDSCECPQDNLQRALLAQRGEACKATTRLNVVMSDLPGLGVWRLESHGYWAAVQLPPVADILSRAGEAGAYLPARLVLAQKTKKQIKGGKSETFTWVVPTILLDATPRQLMSGHAPGAIGAPSAAIGASRPAIESGQPPLPKPTDREGWLARIQATTTADDLTDLLRRAREVLNQTDGQALMPVFEERYTALNPEEFVQGEWVDEDVDGHDLDVLWGAITENAPEGWGGERLGAEFTRRTGARSDSATEEQMREFLAWLKAGAQ
jgi:Recombination directionality factor-like